MRYPETKTFIRTSQEHKDIHNGGVTMYPSATKAHLTSVVNQ